MGTIYRHSNGQWRARYSGPDRRQHTRHFDRKSDAVKWLAGVEVSRAKGEWLDPGRSSVTVADWCGTWLDSQHQLRRPPGLGTRGSSSGTSCLRSATGAVGADPGRDRGLARAAVCLGVVRGVGALLPPGAEHGAGVRGDRWAVEPQPCGRGEGAAGQSTAQATPDARRGRAAGQRVRRLAVLIYLLAYTGLRWGEAVALQVGDTDLMRRRVKVERAMAEVGGKAIFGPPKDYERREVPLPAFLIEDLAAHLAGRGLDELAFPSPCGTVLRNGNFRRNTFDTAAERAGLAGITPHGVGAENRVVSSDQRLLGQPTSWSRSASRAA